MSATAMTLWTGNGSEMPSNQSISIGYVPQGTAIGGGDYWYQPFQWYPYWTYPYWNVWPQQTVTVFTGEPQHCIGKAHVFECDHEVKCKCGKVVRILGLREYAKSRGLALTAHKAKAAKAK